MLSPGSLVSSARTWLLERICTTPVAGSRTNAPSDPAVTLTCPMEQPDLRMGCTTVLVPRDLLLRYGADVLHIHLAFGAVDDGLKVRGVEQHRVLDSGVRAEIEWSGRSASQCPVRRSGHAGPFSLRALTPRLRRTVPAPSTGARSFRGSPAFRARTDSICKAMFLRAEPGSLESARCGMTVRTGWPVKCH